MISTKATVRNIGPYQVLPNDQPAPQLFVRIDFDVKDEVSNQVSTLTRVVKLEDAPKYYYGQEHDLSISVAK